MGRRFSGMFILLKSSEANQRLFRSSRATVQAMTGGASIIFPVECCHSAIWRVVSCFGLSPP
jgi:hypothetical protein